MDGIGADLLQVKAGSLPFTTASTRSLASEIVEVQGVGFVPVLRQGFLYLVVPF